MKVFIDTNVYINFIRTSDEKLKSLDEIEKLIKSGKISLVFPKITLEELIRNIPHAALAYQEDIEKQLPKQPAFAVSINRKRRENIDKIHEEYKEELKRLKDHYLKSIGSVKKKIVEDLWKLAIKLEDTSDLVERAYSRKIKGNPPGKGQHIGDELEWELLLESCSDDDLTIITFDGDWFNLINSKKSEISPLLQMEWDKKTNNRKKLQIFTTLGEFVNELTGKSVISKKEIEKEKKGSGSSSQGFPYAFPVTFASQGTSNVSVYPGTITVQPITQTPWLSSPSSSTSVTWGTVPTTTSSFSASPSASTTTTFLTDPISCKKCGYQLSFVDKFCSECGEKVN